MSGFCHIENFLGQDDLRTTCQGTQSNKTIFNRATLATFSTIIINMKVSVLALASITTLAANAFGTSMIPFAAAEEEVSISVYPWHDMYCIAVVHLYILTWFNDLSTGRSLTIIFVNSPPVVFLEEVNNSFISKPSSRHPYAWCSSRRPWPWSSFQASASTSTSWRWWGGGRRYVHLQSYPQEAKGQGRRQERGRRIPRLRLSLTCASKNLIPTRKKLILATPS